MPDNVQVHFVGNTTIPINVDLEKWAKLFERALQANTAVRVNDPDSAFTLVVNPSLVTHWTHGV
jgi:hypothetical protein